MAKFDNRKELIIDVSWTTIGNSHVGGLSGNEYITTRLQEYARGPDKEIKPATMKRYIHWPENVQINLTDGFSQITQTGKKDKRDEDRYAIAWFLDYIKNERLLLKKYFTGEGLKRKKSSPAVLPTDASASRTEIESHANEMIHFVCNSGTIRLLMLASDCRETCVVYAKRERGIWFIGERWLGNDPVKPKRKYASYMFKLLMTGAPDTTTAASEAKTYPARESAYQISLAKLGDHVLLHSGEIDCWDENDNLTLLKTSRYAFWEHDQRKKFALQNAWVQARILDAKKVSVGLVTQENDDSDIILTKTKEYATDGLAALLQPPEKPVFYMKCLSIILNYLKNDPFFQHDQATYEMELVKGTTKITVTKITEQHSFANLVAECVGAD